MDDKYTIMRIKRHTLSRLRQLAERNNRTAPKQLEVMLDAFEQGQFHVISVSTLPHPPDAQPVPPFTIAKG